MEPSAVPWRAGIYHPGNVVSYDGKIWICSYYRRVMSIDEPGSAEDNIWISLSEFLWRKSPVPIVRRRGWRKKMIERLIRLAETNDACHASLRYIPGPNGQVPHMPTVNRRRYNPTQQRQLRTQLGISAEELRAILDKRKARTMRSIMGAPKKQKET